MSGDGGRHFESCFSFHVYYLVERNVYKSSEFIKEFHVLRDMTMADYERRGGEEITYGMGLISCDTFLPGTN